MTTKRMENWDAGDFYQSFREAAEKSPEKKFSEKFHALADTIEPFQREFERTTVQCGTEMSSLMELGEPSALRADFQTQQTQTFVGNNSDSLELA
jgi:hypothetical protein